MSPRLLPAGLIAPCLPTKTDKLPSGSQWLHEIKHDGFRMLVRRDAAGVRLFTRNGHDWTGRFPLIARGALSLKAASCLIDGEAAKQAAQRHDRQYRVGYRPNPNGVLLDPNYKGKGLQVELTVEDPIMFTTPWTALVSWRNRWR